MNKNYANFAFSLLLAGFLPAMGMNNQNASKWLGISIDEQKKLFNNFDIKKIAENDIDKGILLEQHFLDLKEIESYSPLKRKGAIAFILKKPFSSHYQNIDKQQKMMGMIECAGFINNPVQKDLINYALDNNLIPEEILDESDDTVKSFYQIKNVFDTKPEQTLKLVKELLPNFESNKEYLLDHTFDAIKNDIKTIKYEQDAQQLTTLYNRTTSLDTIKQLFNSTSLSNKISLILHLETIKKSLEPIRKAIAVTSLCSILMGMQYWTSKSLYNALSEIIGSTFSSNQTTFAQVIKAVYFPNMDVKKFRKIIILSSLTGVGLDALFHGSNNLSLNYSLKVAGTTLIVMMSPFVKTASGFCLSARIIVIMSPSIKNLLYELKEAVQKQINIDRCIEEFKDSIKEEYPAVAKGYGGHGKN